MADRLEELEEKVENLSKELIHAYKVMLKAADRFEELKDCIEAQLLVNEGVLIQLEGITKALLKKGIIVDDRPRYLN